MKRVAGREKVGQKPRSRLKSRLYVVWLLLVCVGIVSAMAFMAPAEPAASGGGEGHRPCIPTAGSSAASCSSSR